MKKILPLLLIGALALLSGCEKNGYRHDSLRTLKSDYKKVIKQYPEAEGNFVEARYELNAKVSDAAAKDLYPIRVEYYFYWVEIENEAAYVVRYARDFETGEESEIIKEPIYEPWVEDSHIPNFDGFISLEKALKIIKESDEDSPETVFVTLRHPVLPNGSPRYVFGGTPDRDKHIHVDAVSGEIYIYED